MFSIDVLAVALELSGFGTHQLGFTTVTSLLLSSMFGHPVDIS